MDVPSNSPWHPSLPVGNRCARESLRRADPMKTTHVYRSAAVDWQPHPTLSGIRIKSLENQKTWPAASVTLVEVERGGVIEPHMHEYSYESAYILSGAGVLTVPEGEIALSS